MKKLFFLLLLLPCISRAQTDPKPTGLVAKPVTDYQVINDSDTVHYEYQNGNYFAVVGRAWLAGHYKQKADSIALSGYSTHTWVNNLLLADAANLIHNQTTLQTGANFNIDGTAQAVNFISNSIKNPDNPLNGGILFTDNGVQIYRNVNDDNTVLKLYNQSISGTGSTLNAFTNNRINYQINRNGTILNQAYSTNQQGDQLQYGLAPTANGQTLTGLTVAPIFGKSVIASISINTPGSGYTDGTSNYALTGGTGFYATARVTFTGGQATAITLLDAGVNYLVGDTVSLVQIAAIGTGTTGTGFTATVDSITSFTGIVNVAQLTKGLDNYDQPYAPEALTKITKSYADATYAPIGGGGGNYVRQSQLYSKQPLYADMIGDTVNQETYLAINPYSQISILGAQDTVTNNGGDIVFQPSSTELDYYYGNKTTAFRFQNGRSYFTDGINNKGLEYSPSGYLSYEPNFTDGSLVDKHWVLGQIGSAGYQPAGSYEITSNKVTTLDNSTVHYPTTSAVTAAIAASVPQSPVYGTIFKSSNFTSLLPKFTINGATATVSGGAIQLTGVGTDLTHSLDEVDSTLLDKYSMSVNYIVPAISATTFAPGIGTRSSNSGTPQEVVATLDLTNNATAGTFNMVNASATVLGTSSNKMIFVAGDTIVTTITRDLDKYTVRASNKTHPTNDVSVTYAYNVNANGHFIAMPNVGTFSVFAQSSTPVTITSINIQSLDLMNADIAYVGDSKAAGGLSTAWGNTVQGLLSQYYSVIDMGGPSDITNSVMSHVTEIMAHKPKVVILDIGRNDLGPAHNKSVVQVMANLATITNALTAAGITVLHPTGFAESVVNIAPLAAAIRAAYPTTYIETYIPTAANLGSYDQVSGVHQLDVGSILYTKACLESGLLPSAKGKPIINADDVNRALGGNSLKTQSIITFNSTNVAPNAGIVTGYIVANGGGVRNSTHGTAINFDNSNGILGKWKQDAILYSIPVSSDTTAGAVVKMGTVLNGVEHDGFEIDQNGNLYSLQNGIGLAYFSTTLGKFSTAVLTGLLKGNGAAAPTAAVANTDYLPPVSPVMTTPSIGVANGTSLTLTGLSKFLNSYSTSTVPAIAVGANAGTGATVSIAGNNQDGIITVNTGTSASTGYLCTVTMSGGFAYPTSCATVITPVSGPSITGTVSIAPTATTWKVYMNGGVTSSSTYQWAYHNGGY
jgi:hypothetical protein